jgi:hypothetical protein
MARNRRTEQAHQRAVSDEAAAYIADALMHLALQFENNHYAQIRRHYATLTPEPASDPRQLDQRSGELEEAQYARL